MGEGPGGGRPRGPAAGAAGLRRALGLDRSAPDPPATRSGQPLRPFTLPNAIGFARLCLIPVFLVLALGSDDGQSTAAALLLAGIALGDYADGLAARLSGQYSRLGALMDPVVDRLTVLAGAAVCWHFELLPRWALAALAVRELAMLAMAQWGLRHGIDISINWAGRISVFPVMGAFPLAMIGAGGAAAVLLLVGLAGSVMATALYARAGIRAQRSTFS